MSFVYHCMHSELLMDNQNRKKIFHAAEFFKQMGNYNLGQLSRWLFLKWSNFSTSIGLHEKTNVKECTGCELSQLFLTGIFQSTGTFSWTQKNPKWQIQFSIWHYLLDFSNRSLKMHSIWELVKQSGEKKIYR